MQAATTGMPELRIDVLGPLRVTVGATEIELAAPMHRALLAVMAIHANTVVSTEHLID
ncbi:MAG: hypothetical protein ACC660_03580 [Acidimicrobiales bacterium]